APSNPNNTTCPNPRCPSRLRVIASSLANPRSLAKDGSAHSGRTGGPTRRFPGLTGSTFAPACSLAEPREEGAGEGGAPAGLLVLEVDVDTLPGHDLAHACRPAVQFGVAVVRAPETQVAEGGGGDGRGGEVVGLGDAERSAMLAEEIVGLVVEPALVPELEGGFQAVRQGRQEVGEARGVEAEVGRELEEERAQLRAEPRGGATERRRDLAR